MTKDKALKLALEALDDYLLGDENLPFKCAKALAAIREALAQPEQEPMAWFRYETVYEYKNQLARCTKDCIGAFPVYTTPPHPEPVIDKSAAVRIATALGWEPKRKPLTDEQIMEMYNEPRSDAEMIEFARAIEAAHGIKGDSK